MVAVRPVAGCLAGRSSAGLPASRWATNGPTMGHYLLMTLIAPRPSQGPQGQQGSANSSKVYRFADTPRLLGKQTIFIKDFFVFFFFFINYYLVQLLPPPFPSPGGLVNACRKQLISQTEEKVGHDFIRVSPNAHCAPRY